MCTYEGEWGVVLTLHLVQSMTELSHHEDIPLISVALPNSAKSQFTLREEEGRGFRLLLNWSLIAKCTYICRGRKHVRHKKFNQILCLVGWGCDKVFWIIPALLSLSAEGQILHLLRVKSSGNLKLEVKYGQEVVTQAQSFLPSPGKGTWEYKLWCINPITTF